MKSYNYVFIVVKEIGQYCEIMDCFKTKSDAIIYIDELKKKYNSEIPCDYNFSIYERIVK